MIVIKKHDLLRKELIKQFYYNKRLTLTQLSKLTHKSLPLVTTTVNNLVEEGYILEHGLAPSTGGRRALSFLLNRHLKRYIVAVAIDQFVTQIVMYDMHNNAKIAPEIIEILITKDDPSTLGKLTGFIRSYIRRSGIPAEQILGVGIGMPGFVNADEGVNHSYFKPVGGTSLKEYLANEIELSVYIDNDSSLIALAELKFGAGKKHKDVLVVNVGWGIGLGMIVNGQLFRGHTGYAGEFSHIPLSQTNKMCSCGKRGCLEVDASLLVMIERAKHEIDSGASSSMEKIYKSSKELPVEDFLKAARAGDPLAVSILSDAAFLIGKGISTLIHIMNPGLIVLSGKGATAGKILMAPIQQAINEFCIPWLAEQTEIDVSQLAANAKLLGAATLVIESCDFK
ncbi:ROK family transcriptional regulator [Mucilaginibacter achroorhodeus]|uniref:ROK family transcriptional regulator n=1 Tax=Mucilaginibacter achroorhodeus TaxID=2599294 RepID=A0A563U8Y8_9SPHI|nr:ROK family transcriptional regulator [Mucilaginibacter achroorhodeus]TWR27852.1 ROK family transcriptional regulator [Mucilaginibacter achroorhodeus]